MTGSVITTIDGDFINAYFAGASTNGSTVLLPVLASDLGLKPNGDRGFRYFADSYVDLRRLRSGWSAMSTSTT